MAKNREELIKQVGPVTNQESLVKRLMRQQIKPIKFDIPGGKTLFEDLDKERLPFACYNWLRKCREFTEATIFLCRDPGKYRNSITKIMDFPQSANGLVWVPKSFAQAQDRKWLAEQIGEALWNESPLGVIAKADGLYVVRDLDNKFSVESEDWVPWVQLIPKRREEWAAKIQSVKN